MAKNNIYTFECFTSEDIAKQHEFLGVLMQKALRRHNKVGLSSKSLIGMTFEKNYYFKDYTDYYYIKIKETEAVAKAQEFIKTLSDIAEKDKNTDFKQICLHLKYSHNSPYSHTRHKTPNYYQVFFKFKPLIFIKQPNGFKAVNTVFYEDGLVRIDVTEKGHIVGINWNLPIIKEIKALEIDAIPLPFEIGYTYLEEINTFCPYFYANDKLILPIKVVRSPYIIQPITEFMAENQAFLNEKSTI